MRFWDSSALIPLCIAQPTSETVRPLAREDQAIAAWWTTPVECYSAFARLHRDGVIDEAGEDQARQVLHQMMTTWTEIEPTSELRQEAGRLVSAYPLRGANALQLAAALIWAGGRARGLPFVCLDQRLRAAARKEGFTLLPSELQGTGR